MSVAKTKTQITVKRKLALVLDLIMANYPIYDVNKSVEMLIARGSKDYLDELGLTIEDLEEIEVSRQQICDGKSTKANSIDDLLQKLKS
jgi:hypothetical protein